VSPGAALEAGRESSSPSPHGAPGAPCLATSWQPNLRHGASPALPHWTENGPVRIRAPGVGPAERDYKTVALNRSAIPPRRIYLSYGLEPWCFGNPAAPGNIMQAPDPLQPWRGRGYAPLSRWCSAGRTGNEIRWPPDSMHPVERQRTTSGGFLIFRKCRVLPSACQPGRH